jgi:nicotinamidase-related amidase
MDDALLRPSIHLCVDMQNLFLPGSPWETPWIERVLPDVVRLVEAHPDRCIFTRFIPVEKVGQGKGQWKTYYERWPDMTLEALPPDAVNLAEPLQRFVPPARVIDKAVYSPWSSPALGEALRGQAVETIIVSGAETDICVLAAILGAVDRGYRIILAKDAVCSSTDATHDAILALFGRRYHQQVDMLSVDEILARWL